MIDVIKGKYQIVREIARSNDIVYEAIDTALGRRIALKELNIAPSLTGQARRERIERFNREARAAGRLSHPNIVAVTDFFEENGRHFIAMEFLEGQSLRDAMQVRGAYPLREAVNIASQVLDALAYAHANKVIHRDIKPDNIHILPGGQVKLTDFGIARLTEQPALTSDGQVFGTPSYMSPEQIEGKSIDHRSDLFSLGVLLYEMLAGRKPFVGDSVISITYAVMNAEPPPLHGVPMAVDQVIRRALAKYPNQRYNTAEQMKQDLLGAEQAPAVFNSQGLNQTGMGRTNLGFGYHGTGASLGAPPPPMAGYPPGGYAGPNTGYPSQSPDPASNAGLPWAWNNPGNTGASPPSIFLPQAPGGMPPAGAPPSMMGNSGVNPYAAPPYPQRPAEPLFVLSPGGKAFLISVAVAALLGGLIALGVIAFLRSYDQYKTNVGEQRVSVDLRRGADAYAARDYATAAKAFEQARVEGPSARDLATINYNLVATYIQLARIAEANGKWQDARDLYLKALAISPDDKLANAGAAKALQQLGDTRAAQDHQEAAATGSGPDSLPATLESHAPSTPDTTGSRDPQQLVQDRRQQARQLLEEGNTLYQRGDTDGARDKWQQVTTLAPGTPESARALENIQSTINQNTVETP